MFFMQPLLGRGAIHTRKNKRKGVRGWEKKKRQEQFLHPCKVKKENGNKTWALFPSSSLPLNSFNALFKLNISLLILLQPQFICSIVLYPFCGLSSLSFHRVSLSSVHLSHIPLSSGTYIASISMDQFKHYFWLSDLYPSLWLSCISHLVPGLPSQSVTCCSFLLQLTQPAHS